MKPTQKMETISAYIQKEIHKLFEAELIDSSMLLTEVKTEFMREAF